MPGWVSLLTGRVQLAAMAGVAALAMTAGTWLGVQLEKAAQLETQTDLRARLQARADELVATGQAALTELERVAASARTARSDAQQFLQDAQDARQRFTQTIGVTNAPHCLASDADADAARVLDSELFGPG